MTETGPDPTTNPLIPEHIGPYYVYLLVDPRNDEVFYVGKGTGWRFSAHFEDELLGDDTSIPEESGPKRARIAAIRASGEHPRVEFARRQVQTEQEAYAVEAALIDVMKRHGAPHLTNEVRGHDADLGLITLEELQEQLLTPYMETGLRALLIKLSWWTPEHDTELPRHGYGYRPGMSKQELYDSTRAWWRIDTSRAKLFPYAVAIYQGVTRAVWEIDQHSWRRWDPSGHAPGDRRVAFEGSRLTEGDAFDAFVGTTKRRVPPSRPGGGAVFGSGSPIAYWPTSAVEG